MPLVDRYSAPSPDFDQWALLFRDHYLEHSVGFVLGMERAGIPSQWIYTLDKGDRTLRRQRVHATFLARGYRSDLLDNTAVNDPATHAADLERVRADIDAFIDAAHTDGRRVLVVDDGGLLAQGYGAKDARRRVDAAIELTVSGLKRIAAAEPLGIPVWNMARSTTKTLLGYPEIADSCMRRLRAMVPDRKFIGRHVLLVGYGTLGSRLAPALRTLGCRVDVVDTDLAALISAGEAGYPTHRSLADALRLTQPFLVIGTTGEQALTAADLPLLPDGVLLAPFATRDFSVLADPVHTPQGTSIPGVGTRFPLPDGRHAVLLGDGRSMNLYEADSIPNQGYDAYRAGTLIAARHLCADPEKPPFGLHRERADQVITDAGLFEAYYDLYLAHPQRPANTASTPNPARAHAKTNVCVVGYGVAGRLHTDILSRLGADVAIIDPKHQDLPRAHRSFPHQVSELPSNVAARVDLWSVCTPTSEHLPLVRAILAHNPQARILLEKPACQGHEIDAFTEVLAAHPGAKVMVNDQYRHARVLPAFTDLIADLEPKARIRRVNITFTKDRTTDIANGRFIDRTYGVLGYEWLHMLTVLAHVLPPSTMKAYLEAPPSATTLHATYDPRLFVSALTERTAVHDDAGRNVGLELASSILGTNLIPEAVTALQPSRNHGPRPADSRYRHMSVQAGNTRFILQFAPVTTPTGQRLDRNHHRLAAHRDGELIHETVLHDSPLANALRNAVTALFDTAPTPGPELAHLRRIAALAEYLRAQDPHRPQTEKV
ncbi:hypothetical protein BJF83_20235 [Nocardiopsis sp. CNR-923]|uniref:Gfo/Idh/MocA family oxidoreductase n=1 Tax=Nocardiopsis sp. CNR-923 TaxID=1904965 RepID=UPI0009652A0B|nr:Gfo/Idh/MocA family oxidoreductase [Nocardiopsis sp. CNR-923]OLT26836.1 hypothetical protein BJF83_20235 [Nocardiopsis sp. CNR-923]